ncbi:hypothetical protein PFISCL1PPCAC_4339, partial [Pristionchus fissidentatus]
EIPDKFHKNEESNAERGETLIPETTSLLDLPQEILVKIIERSDLDLRDRANIRATCKSMNSVVV